ncbi:Aurachin b dehydrogenase [Thalictrum thalictroides]|uniref:Aurachin b dehydrogenase n=1 Tax=Thalictrum thalictroides TaxID=46969 RepID=A0A7J6WI79_THATH|nr:Aurachin b dehydrogenase [Thalictrum thalictroides]
MKVLVTGASGYLGSKLCHALLAQGHAVQALVRRTSNLDSLLPVTDGAEGSLDLAYGDITDYDSLLLAFSDCQIIFHVAALVEPWLPDPSIFISVNVGGLENVLKAVRETKTVEKIIYTSSFFALGCTDGGYIANETQVHHEKFFCTEYEKSKVIAEKIAMQASLDGLPIVVLNPGVIYGPGKITAGNVIANMLIERFSGRLPGYIGYGNDKFSFTHVEDIVYGHIAAMHKGRAGERYLLTGENASFKHLFDVAAIITGTRKPWFHIPLWVIEAYGWVSVFISRLTGKIPLISPPTVTALRHQWAYSCEKSKVELGYKPRSLSEGLGELVTMVLPTMMNNLGCRSLKPNPATTNISRVLMEPSIGMFVLGSFLIEPSLNFKRAFVCAQTRLVKFIERVRAEFLFERVRVFYGDGLIEFVSPSHAHLHELASRGSCGFLSLPHSPPAESEDERVVRELALLLDAYDSYILKNRKHSSTSDCLEKSSVPNLSERFMGLRAAIFTNDSSVIPFARFLGLTVVELDDLIMKKGSLKEQPVSELLKLLGFHDAKALETYEFDLIFVHVGSEGNYKDAKIGSTGSEAELINGLIGGVLERAQLGSEISSRLHFSVVMSYGTSAKNEDSLSNFSLQRETNHDHSLLFPRQSYTITGKDSVNKIRHHCPMLIAQWQDAVTRKDNAERFSFEEFMEHGANLAIPADRFLHELAFKLWKAPKYGA